MRAGKLLVQITAYYLIIGLAIFLALKFWPNCAAISRSAASSS